MKTVDNVLTPNPIKRLVYSSDADFAAATELVRGLWTNSDQVARWLWNYAALILRPDAIAAGSAAAILPLLRRHGIVPAAVRPVLVRPGQAESLWRYQFNVATPERRALLGRVMSMGPSLYVLFRDNTIRLSAPATVHLTYLKGTAIVGRRKCGHLRTAAGPSIANVLSYVHVSDDPADVLREMAVLFDQASRRELLLESEANVDCTVETLRLIRRLESCGPRTPLLRDLRDRDLLDPAHRCLVEEWCSIVRSAKSLRSFFGGETYAGRDAIIPDDKELSYPLDSHLVSSELGPR